MANMILPYKIFPARYAILVLLGITDEKLRYQNNGKIK